jgi:hypothetical protein
VQQILCRITDEVDDELQGIAQRENELVDNDTIEQIIDIRLDEDELELQVILLGDEYEYSLI